MSIKTAALNYHLSDTPFNGYYAYNQAINDPLPAVLIVPTWRGCDDATKQKAREIAELGYVGVAIDMYGNGNIGASPEECAALMQPLLDDREQLQARIVTALEAVSNLEPVDHNHIAAIGFCFGGLCALDLARSGADLNGIISIHGLFTQPDTPNKPAIKPKILILHGHDDPLAPPDQMQALIEELNQRKADWEINLYGNTAHAFTNPSANSPDQGLIFDQYANDRAWSSATHFLNRLFA